MIEVFVSRLGLDSSTNSYVVVLQERDGPRLLPIWIGQPEAESIVLHMHDVKRARPLTHDLVRSLILGMGATLRRVQITRVEKSTYYAELQLHRDDTLVNVDATSAWEPADAEAAADSAGAGEDADDEQLSAERLKRYLEALRPEDFGKFTP